MILVTGATGFVGRSLMAQLAQAGLDARPFEGNITAHLQLRPQLDGVDTIIHLAGSEARGRDRLLKQIDLEGSSQLIDEAARADIKHLIFASRLGAHRDSMHALLKTKGEIERRIEASGVPYTILRSSNLYGRGDRFSELILSMALWSWPLVWLPGGGHMTMQPLWVEDFARCLTLVAQNPAPYLNKTWDVAGEERLYYREMVQHMLRINGRRRLGVPLPMSLIPPLSYALFRWWYWPAVSRYFVDRLFVPEIAHTDSVLRQFGFRPARFAEQTVYLRRPGMYGRLFRR